MVDLAARTVRRDGQDIHLTPIEFKLLRLLLRHRGRLLTQHVLMQEVWGPRYVRNTQSLRTHIANLRRKIEPADAEPLIRTDHGVGYRFADSPPRPQPLRVVAGRGRGTAALGCIAGASVGMLRAGVRVGVSGDWPAARGATLTGGPYRGGTATQAERRDAEAGYSVHAPHSQGLSGMRERAELRSAS